MSQNLRVALWVPNVDPAAIGNAIRTTAPPTANKRIPSEFAEAAGGSGSEFATQDEVTFGVVPDEAISPLTLRNDNARIFDIPAGAFLTPIVVVTFAGAAGVNKVVKTAASGMIDESIVPLDGGTF